ncbi:MULTISPECIES: histidine phosphatase family protein [Pseudooceanicola]|uniref:histidine phosphatase family protein n=1 Tax=Pseudooceanicola TaxID=1679449 RepID=UPI0028803E7E|nr:MULTISPECIES: histidine phosphatase family protein [Pseudooceanicola]
MIRHGETDANRAGLIAGRTEAMLTDTGLVQAAALSGLDWGGPVRVWTSPQTRARQTASLAFPHDTAGVLEGLRERDWGALEGRPVSELIPRGETPAGGESWPAMLARVAAALSHALEASQEALPVLVAHSGTIRAIRRLCGASEHGASPRNAHPLAFVPGPEGWRERPVTEGMAWTA